QGNGYFGDSTLTLPDGFVNHGTILLESINSGYNETLRVPTGAITNAADGTIESDLGSGGGRYLAGNLTNQGVIAVGANAGLTINTVSPAYVFTNQGQVNVDATGFLTITQTYRADGGDISGRGYLVNATLEVLAAPVQGTPLLLAGSTTLASDNLVSTTLWV